MKVSVKRYWQDIKNLFLYLYLLLLKSNERQGAALGSPKHAAGQLEPETVSPKEIFGSSLFGRSGQQHTAHEWDWSNDWLIPQRDLYLILSLSSQVVEKKYTMLPTAFNLGQVISLCSSSLSSDWNFLFNSREHCKCPEVLSGKC